MCLHLSNQLHVSTLVLLEGILNALKIYVAVIREVFVNPLSDTSVNVSWESVTVRGIVSYTVFYSPTEATSQQDEQMVTVPSSESSVVIEGLMTNVEYQFQVAAIAQLGEALFPGQRSPPTETVVAQPTSSQIPTPPQTPTPSASHNGKQIMVTLNLYMKTNLYGGGTSKSFDCCFIHADIIITAIVTFLLTTLLTSAVWLVGISLYCVHSIRKKR